MGSTAYLEITVKPSDVREVFETILPAEVLMDAVRSSELQTRERKLDALGLIRAMVIAASTGYGGRQADVMRLYLEGGAEQVVRGGFYRWFGPALEAVMDSVLARALAYVARQRRDLPGWLGRHVKDWVIVDSSTVRLDDRLIEEYPVLVASRDRAYLANIEAESLRVVRPRSAQNGGSCPSQRSGCRWSGRW